MILSPSSVSSTNVKDEVAFALEEHKTVIPVFYRDCKVPFQLRPFQYVDFRTDYDRGLKTLLKTLGVEQPAAAGGCGAAVSAVPKDTAADVPDADERERAAERQRVDQEEKQAAEQARPEGQERERKAPEEKARLFLPKETMIGLAGGVVVLLLVWILWPRRSDRAGFAAANCRAAPQRRPRCRSRSRKLPAPRAASRLRAAAAGHGAEAAATGGRC